MMKSPQLKIHKSLTLIAGALSLMGVVGSVQAVHFEYGDVFAAVSAGNVEHYRAGVLQGTYNNGAGGYTTGMAFNSSGQLYLTNFSLDTITRFDTEGAVIAPNPYVTNDSGGHNESILFDGAGDFYVGQPDGTRDILKRSGVDGSLLDRYDVAIDNRGSDWIDLAADQTTMFYTGEGRRVMRYDLGLDAQLLDFALLPGGGVAYALRLLGDGGLLVADNSNIKRLNSSGAVIQTYDSAGHDSWFSLNLDPDGTSFWSGDIFTGDIHKYDIASGAELAAFHTVTGGGQLYGVAVFGEITQGCPDCGGTIPEPATLALMSLGLVGLGFSRKRKVA